MNKSYYVLEIRDPDFDAERYEISELEVYLGRSQSKADIVVPDLKASGRHCRLDFDGLELVVTDLESTNGTWFDGARLTRKQLSPGEVFAIGDSEIRLVSVHEVASRDNEPLEATRAMDANELFALTGNPDWQENAELSSAGTTVSPEFEGESVALQSIGSQDVAEREVISADEMYSDLGDRESTPSLESTSSLSEALQSAHVTTAFDRSSVPIGSTDITEDSARLTLPEPMKPGRARLFLVSGLVLIIFSLFTISATFIPGGEPQLQAVEGPGSKAVALAALSWSSVASETIFAPYVSGTLYEALESHYENSVSAQAIAADSSLEVPRRKASLATSVESARYAKSCAKQWFSAWERVQLGLWIAAVVALVAGILLTLGWHRVGVALSIFSIIGPIASGQPVPILSFAIAMVFCLVGLVMLAVLVSMRKSDR